jgi:hypothetical protein
MTKFYICWDKVEIQRFSGGGEIWTYILGHISLKKRWQMFLLRRFS